MFGTSGIRRVFAGFGDEFKNFTPKAALKIGLAIGTYINGGTVIVGKDIRTTALPIELALNSGLVSTGCRVLTIGTVTTPTVAMSSKFLDGDIGIMITASHNTPEWIGLKLWNPSGLGFTPEQEQALERIYKEKRFNKVSWDKIGSITTINDINNIHVNEILKMLHLGETKRPNVIIDPGNGSSYQIAPLLIKKLGCTFATLNSNPDGHFPGRLSEPSSQNLKTLISFIRSTDDIDFGIALDGDADRIIFVDGNGKIIEPIRLMAFLSKQLLLKDPPRNGMTYKFVTPINSSGVLEHVIEPIYGKVIKSQVGDAKVALEMQKSRALLGGENSGVYIWPKFHFGPDSLVTVAKIVEILSHSEKSFTELMEEIPEFSFVQKEYPLREDIPFSDEDYENITGLIISHLESQGFTKITKSIIDGIRIDYEDGWLMVRRSGTNPIVRVAGENKKGMDELNKEIDFIVKFLKQDLQLI